MIYIRSSLKKLLIISSLLILIDFLTKTLIARSFVANSDSTYQVSSFLNILYISNSGISFGIFSGKANSNIAFLILNLSILIYVTHLIYREKNTKVQYALMFIFSGGIGNLIDRIRFGHVVDFLDFHFFGYHWPLFNFADTLISLASLYLLYFYFNETFKGKKIFFFLCLTLSFMLLMFLSNCSEKKDISFDRWKKDKLKKYDKMLIPEVI